MQILEGIGTGARGRSIGGPFGHEAFAGDVPGGCLAIGSRVFVMVATCRASGRAMTQSAVAFFQHRCATGITRRLHGVLMSVLTLRRVLGAGNRGIELLEIGGAAMFQ